MDGGMWVVVAELGGQDKMHKDKACGQFVPRRAQGVGTVSNTMSTCSQLPSAAVMGLHWVAVTWAQSIDMLGNATSSSASDQIRSVAQSCPTLCNPMNRSTPGLPVHHQLLEFTETHIHWVSDAIQPSHPLSSPSPPASNPSQHQGLFQWINTSHEVAKVLEFQL